MIRDNEAFNRIHYSASLITSSDIDWHREYGVSVLVQLMVLWQQFVAEQHRGEHYATGGGLASRSAAAGAAVPYKL